MEGLEIIEIQMVDKWEREADTKFSLGHVKSHVEIPDPSILPKAVRQILGQPALAREKLIMDGQHHSTKNLDQD